MPDLDVRQAPGRLRLILNAPHGNAITDAMVGALRAALDAVPAITPAVKLVTLESAGQDFSFGSSLHEHVPSRMPDVLPRFHALISVLLRAPAPTLALVSGRCLGGGFELALACDAIIASDEAVLGLPEISVGAFAPVGSILLPLKAGASCAASALLSGAARTAGDWHRKGLIEQVVPRADLSAAAERWYGDHLARHSAAALRRAALASRLVVLRAVDAVLPQAERLYLNDLLTTSDAAEGVAAFLEKRPPKWTDA